MLATKLSRAASWPAVLRRTEGDARKSGGEDAAAPAAGQSVEIAIETEVATGMRKIEKEIGLAHPG